MVRKRRAHPLIVVVLWLAILPVGGGCALLWRGGMPAETIASVDGDPIPVGELRAELLALRKAGTQISQETVTRGLDELIDTRLIVHEAYRMGLEDDPEVVKDLERFVQIQSIIRMEWDLMGERVKVTEEELWDRYRAAYEKRRVQLLQVRDRSQSEGLLAQARGGKPLSRIASEQIQALMEAETPEEHPFFWEGEVTRKLFSAAEADRLFSWGPGEIHLLETTKGVYLTEILERPTSDAEGFEKARKEVEREIRSEKAQEVLRAHRQELRQGARIEVEEEMLAGLESERLLSGDGVAPESGQALARVNGEPITVGDFLRRYRGDLSHLKYSNVPQAQKNRNVLEKAIGFALDAQAARARDYVRRSPDLQGLAKAHLERTLYGRFVQKVVLDGLRPSSEELTRFYEERRDQFAGPARVALKGVILAERAQAEEVRGELQEGADIDFLVGQVSLPSPLHYRERWIEVSQLPPAVAAEVKRLKVGELSSVLSVKEGHLVFRLVGRQEGRPYPPAEIQSRLKRGYRRERGQEVLKAYLKRLREVVRVRINSALLRSLMEDVVR